VGHGRYDGEVCAAITQDVVHLYAQRFGRGPTQARTNLLDNAALCVLQDLATPAEQTLIDEGHLDAARSFRAEVRESLRQHLIQIVEHHTRREVVELLSDYRPESDIAALVFVLRPSPSLAEPAADTRR